MTVDRLREMSQQELDAHLDAMVRDGKDDGPEWDAAYAEWERRG